MALAQHIPHIPPLASYGGPCGVPCGVAGDATLLGMRGKYPPLCYVNFIIN
jgi:hypothetical protein